MDGLTSSKPMHFYDTLRREIACGVRGAQHRSTKHARFVTCPACLALAGQRPDPEDRRAVH
jgi:hypothetical protein